MAKKNGSPKSGSAPKKSSLQDVAPSRRGGPVGRRDRALERGSPRARLSRLPRPISPWSASRPRCAGWWLPSSRHPRCATRPRISCGPPDWPSCPGQRPRGVRSGEDQPGRSAFPRSCCARGFPARGAADHRRRLPPGLRQLPRQRGRRHPLPPGRPQGLDRHSRFSTRVGGLGTPGGGRRRAQRGTSSRPLA